VSRALKSSQCKRDALPAELTARAAEIADFSDFINADASTVRGTVGEQTEASGAERPEIVPKLPFGIQAAKNKW
jgi:hypothetical protein